MRFLAFGLVAVLACFYAELVGYGLHRLMHSEIVPWLSRRHMAHHVQLYGPRTRMRTATYLDRDAHRGVGGVGWEWVVPSVVLFAFELAVLCALGVPATYQAVVFVGGFVWSAVMFHRAHEAMHVDAPSLFQAGPLRRWFLRARRMHDIHHLAVDDAGRFGKNFGITFFLFDRLFGSYERRLSGINDAGVATAEARYGPRVASS